MIFTTCYYNMKMFGIWNYSKQVVFWYKMPLIRGAHLSAITIGWYKHHYMYIYTLSKPWQTFVLFITNIIVCFIAQNSLTITMIIHQTNSYCAFFCQIQTTEIMCIRSRGVNVTHYHGKQT